MKMIYRIEQKCKNKDLKASTGMVKKKLTVKKMKISVWLRISYQNED
jgi:hypothetical protein